MSSSSASERPISAQFSITVCLPEGDQELIWDTTPCSKQTTGKTFGDVMRWAEGLNLPCMIAAIQQTPQKDLENSYTYIRAHKLISWLEESKTFSDPQSKLPIQKIHFLWNRVNSSTFEHVATVTSWPAPSNKTIPDSMWSFLPSCYEEYDYMGQLEGITNLIEKLCHEKPSGWLHQTAAWLEALHVKIKILVRDEAEMAIQPAQRPEREEILPDHIWKKIHAVIPILEKELAELEHVDMAYDLVSWGIGKAFGFQFIYPATPERLIEMAKVYFDCSFTDHISEKDVIQYTEHLLKHAMRSKEEELMAFELHANLLRWKDDVTAHKNAVRIYRSLIQQYPRNEQTKTELASILYESALLHNDLNVDSAKMNREAQRLLEEVHERNPLNQHACLLLARTYCEKRPGTVYDLEKAKSTLANSSKSLMSEAKKDVDQVLEQLQENESSQKVRLTKEALQAHILRFSHNNALFLSDIPPASSSHSEESTGSTGKHDGRCFLDQLTFQADPDSMISYLAAILESQDPLEKVLQEALLFVPGEINHPRLMKNVIPVAVIWKNMFLQDLKEVAEKHTSYPQNEDINYEYLDQAVYHLAMQENFQESDIFYLHLSLRYGKKITSQTSLSDLVSSMADIMLRVDQQSGETNTHILNAKILSHIISRKMTAQITQLVSERVVEKRLEGFRSLSELLQTFGNMCLRDLNKNGDQFLAVDALYYATNAFIKENEGSTYNIRFLHAKAAYFSESVERVSEGQSVLQKMYEDFSDFEGIQQQNTFISEVVELLAKSYGNPRNGAEKDLEKGFKLLQEALSLTKKSAA